MKKRHPAAVLLLPFATLGIYCIYWLYKTRQEILSKLEDKNAIPPLVVLLLPMLLVILLFAVGIFFNGDAQTADTQDDNLGAGGIISIALVLLFFIGGVVILPLWWFWKYCKAAIQVTQEHGMDFAQLYILFVAVVWLCGILPIWMLITQLDYNKVAALDGKHPRKHHPKAPLPA